MTDKTLLKHDCDYVAMSRFKYQFNSVGRALRLPFYYW